MKKISLQLSAALITAGTALAPMLAHAQYIPQGGDAKVLLFGALGLLPLIPKAIFAIAVIGFLLGIVNATIFKVPGFPEVEPDKKHSTIMWMFGGLFLMFAMYGIIAVISNTLGIGVG